MWERMTKRWGYLLAILGREKTQKREIRLASHALIIETWQTLWMMHYHHCGVSHICSSVSYIKATACRQIQLCKNLERETESTLSHKQYLCKKETIFKKRLESNCNIDICICFVNVLFLLKRLNQKGKMIG